MLKFLKRSVLAIAVSIALCQCMVACNNTRNESSDVEENANVSSSNKSYNGEEGKITVYLSGPEFMVNELEEAFENERGDVVEMFHAGCGPLKQKIYTEVESDNLHADVYFGSNPLIYYDFIEKGALESFHPENADKIKDGLNMGDDYFHIVNTRYQTMIFDKSKVDTLKSYNDLVVPERKDLIAYTDPSQSDTALALTCALYEINDNSMVYFEKMKENNPLICPKSKTIPEKIQAGEIEAGISPHDAVVRLNRKAKKEGYKSNLGMAFPEEGAIRIERPIAIMKNDARPEENTELAKEFVNFMLSEEAQQITAKYAFYPSISGIAQPKGLPEKVKETVIDWEVLSKEKDKINEKFAEIFETQN